MKLLILALFSLIALVIGQTPATSNGARELAEALEKRADALIHEVYNEIYAEVRANDAGHLVAGLERQLVILEALNMDLRAQLQDPNLVQKIHHVRVIEEELLHVENRISEELLNIREVQRGADRRGETSAQLLERAERLIKEAQDAVVKYPQAREVAEINSEIIVVKALVSAIQARQGGKAATVTPAELQRQEEELARLERVLQQLIQRATQRATPPAVPATPTNP